MISTEEVAGLILYLASEEATFVTGTNIAMGFAGSFRKNLRFLFIYLKNKENAYKLLIGQVGIEKITSHP